MHFELLAPISIDGGGSSKLVFAETSVYFRLPEIQDT